MPKPTLSGALLLRDPRENRGTAFTTAERRSLKIEGMLPPVPATLEIQVSRVRAQLEIADTDLLRYLLLSDLQTRNEVLFYAVLMSDPARLHAAGLYADGRRSLPEVRPYLPLPLAGMYIPITAKGRLQGGTRQLAGKRRSLHRRHRRRTHPRPRRSRRRRHGHPDRQTLALHRLRRRAARSTPCPSPSTSAPTTTCCSKIRSISACASIACAGPSTTPSSTNSSMAVQEALPEMLHPMGGLRELQRRADPGALPRPDLHL